MVATDPRAKLELRASTRHEVELEARLGVAGEVVPCMLSNVSRGGAFATVGRLFAGTEVRLWFTLPTADGVIEIDATVRWSTPEGVGVQFGSMRARDAYALGRYLAGLD